ncbi:MAG: large conductance mechanosensitive channel protein MscL [Myxococcales bacterium]|nr:large conductance mechanosensitive channel protein MscL [Myxococcales bacterium]MCB9703531.1 large conductance mechanosensitive channel protein MscL [Myxococcales bacterium]
MLKDFKAFAIRGNLVDMAVGITVGAAFGTIAKSLVTDLLMPPVGLALGGVKFADLFVVLKDGATAGPYATLADAAAAGAVTINYGVFLDNVVAFLVVAFAVFLLVRMVERMRREEPPPPPTVNEKECPFCVSKVPLKATRCAYCTSELG